MTGNPGLAAGFAVGSLGLLLYYEGSHYVSHRPIAPLTPWGRWMKKYHLWHHFKNEHDWYGVTNPSMDLLFGTYRDVSAAVGCGGSSGGNCRKGSTKRQNTLPGFDRNRGVLCAMMGQGVLRASPERWFVQDDQGHR